MISADAIYNTCNKKEKIWWLYVTNFYSKLRTGRAGGGGGGGCLVDKISVKHVPRKRMERWKDRQGRQTDRRTDPIL